MPRTLSLLSLTVLLALGACGSGSGGSNSAPAAQVGPAALALPIFGDGSAKTLALRNLAGTDAIVAVSLSLIASPFAPLPFSPFTVPALGEVHIPIGAGDGWLLVETSGATTGLVEPYLLNERSGPDEEAVGAAVFATTQSAIPIGELTDKVLFFNNSKIGAVPTAADFIFTFHATDGTATVLPAPTINAQGSNVVLVASGVTGQLSVVPVPGVQAAPPGTDFVFTLATHDDNDIVLDVDDQRRLLDAGTFSTADLILDFGKDADGNYHDFNILASNISDAGASFTIQSIRDASGNVILGTARNVNLNARNTRLYASNLADSVGLVNPEVHPFADLFGDVFATTSLTRFRMVLAISAGAFLTARQFDPLAGDFAMRVRPMARRHTLSVLVSEAQTTTAGGILNTIQISNPTAGPMTVALRAFTKVKGTEYVLPSVVVPAFSMLDWSPDALGLREDVGDLVGPEVRDLRIVLASNVAFVARAYQKTRNGADLIVMLRPHIIRQDD